MSTDDRKPQAPDNRKDNADEKVKDLPTPQQSDKDEQSRRETERDYLGGRRVRMSSDHSRQSDLGQDDTRLGDLPAKSEHDEVAAAQSGNLSAPVQVLRFLATTM